MSAFLCSAKHISAVVNAAARCPHFKIERYLPDDARAAWMAGVYETPEDAMFAVLLHENLVSIGARYPDAPRVQDWTDDEPRHTFAVQVAPIAAIKLAQSLRYQSCEHEGWKDSEARAFLDALIEHLIYVLPGYDEAPWSL